MRGGDLDLLRGEEAREAGADHAALSLLAFVEIRSGMTVQWPEGEDWQPMPIVHRVGSIAALADLVSIEEYSGGDAVRRMRSIEWLAPRITRHAGILHWAMQWSPVFPIPFGTLYRSREGLSVFIRAHAEAIESFFRTVAGKQEWTLKAASSFDNSNKLEALARRSWSDWHMLAPGTRYMRLCRERAALTALAREEACLYLADLVAELRPAVADLKANESAQPAAEGRVETIGSYALLVEIGATARLQAQMRDLTARAALHDVALSLSGPRPPFGFRPDLA